MTEDRLRSELCKAGEHKKCEASSLIGICGCECHDDLDEMEAELYGHGTDAEIASDTNEFDSLSVSVSGVPEGQEEEFKKIAIQVSRAQQFAGVSLNSREGIMAVLRSLYVQNMLSQAKLLVFEKVAQEKLGVSDKELVSEIGIQLEKMLDLEQIANKIIITPDGVFKEGQVDG